VRRFRLRTLRWLFLLLLCGVLTAIILRWVSLERWRLNLQRAAVSPVRKADPTPTPQPTATRAPVIGGKLETARLFSGITVNTTVEPTPGGAAADERADPQSYVLDLKLRLRVPTPNKTIEELAQVSPELPRLLPGLAAMIGPDSVSPFFTELYETKLRRIRANLTRLDQLLSRHNFYDCQTILQLKHPETQRKAVLIQSEMDVDADGSDSDRLPAGSGTSPFFQPYTSYRWPKRTTNPSAYLGMLEERIKTYEAEAALKTTSAARKAELKGGIAQSRDGIDQLKRFSFLIGATDPFIVIPGGFSKTEGAKVGDYAVVIHGESIYPAIVGDVGPADKAGEASLRIAKEISGSSNPMNRPVSDLKVTYLIFPGTADTPWGPPDLEKIHQRCEALVNEIGGAGVPLHKWENIIPPPPTPTPSPTPTPTPSPGESPSASTSPSGSPGASPAPTFAFPLPSASASPSPSPATSPAATASPKASATPTPKASPSPSPRPKPSPSPAASSKSKRSS
jgi:hypothetical protein